MPGTSSTKESDSSAQRHSLDLISNGTFGSYFDIKERVLISISFILVSFSSFKSKSCRILYWSSCESISNAFSFDCLLFLIQALWDKLRTWQKKQLKLVSFFVECEQSLCSLKMFQSSPRLLRILQMILINWYGVSKPRRYDGILDFLRWPPFSLITLLPFVFFMMFLRKISLVHCVHSSKCSKYLILSFINSTS